MWQLSKEEMEFLRRMAKTPDGCVAWDGDVNSMAILTAKIFYRNAIQETNNKEDIRDIAHEIWAAAQLAPGEGIEDGVGRIGDILAPRLAENEKLKVGLAKTIQPAGHKIATVTRGFNKAPAISFELRSFAEQGMETIIVCGGSLMAYNKLISYDELQKIVESIEEMERLSTLWEKK